MKNIIKVIIISLLFLGITTVKAESFIEGQFISGEYISKKNNGKIYYLTVQFLKDNNGNIVYCLEPYTKFVDGKGYTSYEGNIEGYANLSSVQKRKISLIVYYGYGYSNRTSNKWYAITQYLIWDVVTNNDGSIYFTDSLNGKKIAKYSSEIELIMSDVNKHDVKPNFIHDYDVDYENDLIINTKEYKVIQTNLEYDNTNNLMFKKIVDNGSISLSKISNYYDKKVAIFDSTNSQDLIRPGNVDNPIYNINVKVKKGNIVLDIKHEEDVYSIEKDFSDTCYEILKNDSVVDSVCANDNLVYSSIDLAYGDYVVKQTSNGIGYKKDENIYHVKIDENNIRPVLNIHNYLIKNEIVIKKLQCINDNCLDEENAKFSIYDKNKNLVSSIISAKNGIAKIILGYGTYTIRQDSGALGYTLCGEYQEQIIDEESSHYKELKNYYIEKKVKTVIKEELVEEEPITLEVPNTMSDLNWFERIIFSIAQFFIGIYNKFVN